MRKLAGTKKQSLTNKITMYNENLITYLNNNPAVDTVWMNEEGGWSFHDRTNAGYTIVKHRDEILGNKKPVEKPTEEPTEAKTGKKETTKK